jgi:hypothetical protein
VLLDLHEHRHRALDGLHPAVHRHEHPGGFAELVERLAHLGQHAGVALHVRRGLLDVRQAVGGLRDPRDVAREPGQRPQAGDHLGRQRRHASQRVHCS